jgi:hypothetical protein
MSDLRQAGLRIRKTMNTEGNTTYFVSRRLIDGTQGYVSV